MAFGYNGSERLLGQTTGTGGAFPGMSGSSFNKTNATAGATSKTANGAQMSNLEMHQQEMQQAMEVCRPSQVAQPEIHRQETRAMVISKAVRQNQEAKCAHYVSLNLPLEQ